MNRIIIDKKAGHFDYLEIVLCKIDNEYTPFVTWLHNKTDNGFYHGSYHSTLTEALTDFNDRGAS